MKLLQNNKMGTLVSIIIPVYNEEDCLGDCLFSLSKQSYQELEIIVVDDGSTDDSIKIAKKFGVKILAQSHKGPGLARNLGASNSKGEILVFVDSDMTFEKDFIKDLTKPIILSSTIGTFSKNEMVSNADNHWSICWNINRNTPKNRMLPKNYPNVAPVFRAILKSEFEKVKGFETTGDYTDDWSISEKLNIKSTLVPGATYYHLNPGALKEIWRQARWIGKNKFNTGTTIRKFKSLAVYNPLTTVLVGIYKSIRYLNFRFLVFKIIYNNAVFLSVLGSFGRQNKYK